MINYIVFESLDIEGLYKIHPFRVYDERGTFTKDFSTESMIQNKFDFNIVEVFYTNSYKGVIRALHFQSIKEQAKLIRCISGKIFDVVVDLRTDSPTFGQWRSFILSEENSLQLLIPKGFAHGYLVLENAIVSYKCDEKFYAEYDSGIKWNDKDLKIDWPLDLVEENIIISERDQNLKSFREYIEGFISN
jgi:dTDP-4-dehydrorhamnose 3,5-epimerase